MLSPKAHHVWGGGVPLSLLAGDPSRTGLFPTCLLCMSEEQENMSRKNSGGGYSIHQHQGNKQFGTEKVGFLYKKSDG